MLESSRHTSEMMTNVLEIKNLVVTYGKSLAIRGINMVAQRGTITTLIGANGAGKTTLLRAISGLKKVDRGEIYFNNQRIDQLPTEEIVSLGIAHVPEGRRLFSQMTVKENLELGAYLRKNKDRVKQDVERVLSYFPDLKIKLNQAAGDLSGGQQQMVAIGRALMAEPALLLLDEPSVGLSPIMVKEILKIIQAIQKQNISVLLIEQNAKIALNVADIAYVLRNGEIIMEGRGKALLQDQTIKEAYLGA